MEERKMIRKNPMHDTVNPPGQVRRGVLSDNAKTLSDVIDRVHKSLTLHEEYATVWHEGSKSFYHAKLLRKMTTEEVAAENGIGA